MKFNTEKHHRRSMRLKGYDYAQAGGYFVTVVTQSRRCLFGEIIDGQPRLSEGGRMVQQVWDDLPNHYPGIECDAFVVMPNHVHGVIILVGAGPRACPPKGEIGQPRRVAPTMSLPDLVHRFKTLTTNRYVHGVRKSGWTPFSGRLWQRNYYEHIIRDQAEFNRIREYVANNPLQWENDRENPARSIIMGANIKPAREMEPWEA